MYQTPGNPLLLPEKLYFLKVPKPLTSSWCQKGQIGVPMEDISCSNHKDLFFFFSPFGNAPDVTDLKPPLDSRLARWKKQSWVHNLMFQVHTVWSCNRLRTVALSWILGLTFQLWINPWFHGVLSYILSANASSAICASDMSAISDAID